MKRNDSSKLLFIRFCLVLTTAITPLVPATSVADTLADPTAAAGPADSIAFRVHPINTQSTYSAAAAMDVDKDGRLDIVCGGWWYRAPNWQRYKIRDVQQIRGRFDDYSNLPHDVDGDGNLDLISVNYRSQSIYWVRNPGPKLSVDQQTRWPTSEIARPGAMETGRLVDIDQDGRVDLLPNGVKFAAWWELLPAIDGQPKFVRHDLPSELAGHGVGSGDIDGDGRLDLIGARGWLQAPEDRRRGRWRWHAEFELPRDCSIPILVQDVDGDGDQDLIWGRGHSIGLYWLENVAAKAGASRRWIRHTIDTSWSQPHSLLLADIDGDGQAELVAGKRYMGHDGKDPGEYDPQAAYWYKYDRKKQLWRRHTIFAGPPAGFGLDPKAVDLDGDGDIDFIGPGRSGLYLLENLRINAGQSPKQTLAAVSTPSRHRYPDPRKLLTLRDEGKTSAAPLDNLTQLAQRRKHILDNMQLVMGQLPASQRRSRLDIEWKSRRQTEHGYTRFTITYQAEPGDRVPAYLLVPDKLARYVGPDMTFRAPPQRAGAMLCLHQTTKTGKGQPAGLSDRPSLHYAHELAQRGYICLAPDYPSFGDYRYNFHKPDRGYASGSMKAIWNNIRAVDLLESLPIVSHDQIGCIGHSLGGHNSLFTAAFDQRLRAVITSCGFTAFAHYYDGNLAGWTSDRYMPRIHTNFNNDPALVPFDFSEVLAAIAPRNIFVCAPVRDSNFAVAGVRAVQSDLLPVYQLWKVEKNITFDYPDAAHDFPDSSRQKAYKNLQAVVKPVSR